MSILFAGRAKAAGSPVGIQKFFRLYILGRNNRGYDELGHPFAGVDGLGFRAVVKQNHSHFAR